MSHDQDLIIYYRDRLQHDDSGVLLDECLQGHSSWREKKCINLLASEGPMSIAARTLLAGPLCSRTAAGHIGNTQRFFAGTHYIDQLEALCHALCIQLFNCKYVEHRILGGTQANQIVYASLLKRGDTIISVSPRHGGDSSAHFQSMLTTMGIKIIDMPFDQENYIDIAALDALLHTHKPALLSIGFSLSLYPPDYKSIFTLCRHHNVLSHADCAHELGLIAGEAYPNPLMLGADVMSGSTGKTLSGPQGGILLWNNEAYTTKFLQHTFPYSVGGYQNNRIAALTLTLSELQHFGKAYMHQAIANAQALAHYLRDDDIVVYGTQPLTCTHQVLIDVKDNNRAYMRRLESCNLITSITNIPGVMAKNSGLRFGVMECTRMGMGTSDMKTIASFIARALKFQEPSYDIVKEVSNFRSSFSKHAYCHHHPCP